MSKRNAGSFTVIALATLAIVPFAAQAQCTPSGSWTAPFEAPTALNNVVNTLTDWDPDGPGPLNPILVVGGGFTTAGGIVVNRTATWNGTNWAPMGTGVTNGAPQVMLSWDPDGDGPSVPQIAMGGFFTAVGGVAARNVGHWDGNVWAPFSTGTQSALFPDVYAATLFDPDGPSNAGGGPLPSQLVIAGDFTVAGGASRRRLAIWDGAAWGNLGGGASDSVFAVCTFDPDGAGPEFPRLVAGGFFTVAGSTACNRIAMLNGVIWEPMGAGFEAQVECLASVDPDGSGPERPLLFAGGTFLNSGITTVNRIAQYNGSGGWLPMNGGLDNRPLGMTSWDPDGPGPLGNQLVVCGAFVNAGGVTVNRIARYDGEWHDFAGGMNASVNAVATWDPDGDGPQASMLIAGGSFTTAGGIPANRIAAWPVPTVCAPDFNCDGVVDFFDYLDFVDAFSQLLASSDFNHDGTIDFFDYLDFVDGFSSGC